VPFSDLYQKLLTDWASGTNSIDAGVFAPQWMVDYVTPGYLEDLSGKVAGDKDLKLDDIGQFFREAGYRPSALDVGSNLAKPLAKIHIRGH
jgi:multiple sugar transport system substrate-binding protein